MLMTVFWPICVCKLESQRLISIDLMHWTSHLHNNDAMLGVKICHAGRTCCAGRALAMVGSQSVRGPRPARRYGMQGLARWLHAWRWRTWQCLVWPPTRGGVLLWHHMHKVYCKRSIVKFKSWSGGVFQWPISQITQWNHCMNALISKFWFGRWCYVTFWTLPPINQALSNGNSITNEIAISMSEEHRNEPCFSLLWNAEPHTLRSLFLVCTLGNSNITITIRNCNFKSAFVWKHSQFHTFKSVLIW